MDYQRCVGNTEKWRIKSPLALQAGSPHTICQKVIPFGPADDATDKWVHYDTWNLWFHVDFAEMEDMLQI